MERRMAKAARQMDHLERARREEEAGLLADFARQRAAQDAEAHAALVEADAARHRAQWEADLAEKQRLAVVMEDKMAFAVSCADIRGGGVGL
jgi:translation initiation factor 3 subunit A